MPEGLILPFGSVDLTWLRLDLLGRLLLAAVLGGVIGLEREASGKPAGFRTNLLICVGAALLTELSVTVGQVAGSRTVVADPGRIAAQIVSGIGFLGAGTIIQARGNVVGLTTAATLWVVAAIGMAVGARAYVEAVGTTFLVIVALMMLGRVEAVLIRRNAECTIQVTIDPDPGLVQIVARIIEGAGYSVTTLGIDKDADSYTVSFRILGPRTAWSDVLRLLTLQRGVRRVAQV